MHQVAVDVEHGGAVGFDVHGVLVPQLVVQGACGHGVGLSGADALGGEIVECTFMAELEFLNGRTKLPTTDVYSLLKF